MEYFVAYVGVKGIPSHRVEEFLRSVKKTAVGKREGEHWFFLTRQDREDMDIKRLDPESVTLALMIEAIDSAVANAQEKIAAKVDRLLPEDFIRKEILNLPDKKIEHPVN